MKLKITEKMIENQILSWLKMKGIFAFKVKTVGTFDQKLGRFRKPSPWYRKGVSDIIGMHNGTFLAIEVKSKKGKCSEEQVIFLREVLANGGKAIVARSIEDVAQELGEKVK